MTTNDTTTIPVLDVPLAVLHESPDNPRRTFPEKKLAELAASIASVGIIEPLVARPRDPETLWLVAGARRFRAAALAGLASVPVRVMELSDEQALELSVIENLQREDPHPYEEGRGFEALIRRAAYTTASVAERVGKGEDYVRQRLRLTSLCPQVTEAFLNDEITFSHAVQIAPLLPATQEEALAFLRHEPNHKPSAAQLAHWLQEEIFLDLAAAHFDTASPDLGTIPCTVCPKRTGYDPMLFPEVREKDTCTDSDCFQAKGQAHLVQIEAKAREANRGQELVHLNADYYPYGNGNDKPEGLARSQWNPAKDGCPSPAAGIVVAGSSQDTPIGMVLQVCRAVKDCPVHKPSARHAQERRERPAKAVLDERRSEWDFDTKRQAQTAVLAELIDKHPPKPNSRADLEVIARRCFDRLQAENRKKILRRREWIPERNQPSSAEYDAIVVKRFEPMTDAQVFAFLLEIAICDDAFATFGRYDSRDTFKTSDLYRAAQRQKVPADAIVKRLVDARAARFATKYAKLLDAEAAAAKAKAKRTPKAKAAAAPAKKARKGAK